ncbi:hypothetical protein G7Y89_g4468 [Cudoniella acicularis]|uniref:Uncharacterized protein n=1 Tax=Cudoniella acicularis TaxID=354080 RepID=A0A8H4RQP0_9HELO|nr:hypothetical protein G7Y89_g4468 [Cudoniella acicularis]
MSAEVVKKRGRPKKIVLDQVDSEVPELTKKSTTRAKSTKTTTSKTTKPKAATPAKSPAAADPISKATIPSTTPPKSAPKPSPSPGVKNVEAQPSPTKPITRRQMTPETSKILGKVRELSQKTTAPKPVTISSSKAPEAVSGKPSPNPTTNSRPVAKSAPIPPKPIPVPPKSTHTPSPPKPANPPPPPFKEPAPIPTTKPRIPIAALNSEIVSNITSRAGARPAASGSQALPPNYKLVARKVTMAIVAMPILIVTSWVLYERLIMGEERKHLVKPGLAAVESSADQNPETSSNSTST